MKSLVIYNYKIIGITEEEFTPGDVVEIEFNNEPIVLLVNLVSDKPNKISTAGSERTENSEAVNLLIDNSSRVDDKYDKIVYLVNNPKASKKYKKITSQKLEKNMAKTLGGNTTPGSGAFDGNKGDVKSKEWLGEHKYTDSKQYRLQYNIWSKIAKEASEINRTPILEVVLDQTGDHLRLMFMTLHDFYEKSYTSEEQLLNSFYFKQYKPSKKVASIVLKSNEINEHKIAASILSTFKLPGFFITFDSKLSLIGLLSQDFESIFENED